jgi:hypothetical protein
VFRRLLVLAALLSLAFWTACGSGNPQGNSGNLGGGGVNPPMLVSVSNGSTTSGVNVVVPSPGSSPTPNATALGVGGNSAFSTGGTIQRGSAPTVLIFGQGVSASMAISISGPNDITITNVTAIQATDGTPGISFTASVPGNAAVGARTVILQDTKNDITTFTGGLEVQ